MAEKVELPTNITVTVQFLRDDCRSSSHPEYGESFSHFVNAAYPDKTRIERGSMRATALLQDAILQAGCGKLAVAEITRKEGKNRRVEWQVVLRRAPESPGFAVKPWDDKAPGDAPKAQAPMSAIPTPNITSAPVPFPAEPALTLADLCYFYEECLIAAQMVVPRILGEVPADIVKDVATTLFIEGNKRKLAKPKPQDEVEVIIGDDNDDEPDGRNAGPDDDLPF
jgi:hypothetical protein